jgi:hypothetical protein
MTGDRIEQKLNRLLLLTGALLIGEAWIMAELDDLVAAVTAAGAGIDSAIALMDGLAAKLDAAIATGNPAALVALSDALKTKTAALAKAQVTDARP